MKMRLSKNIFDSYRNASFVKKFTLIELMVVTAIIAILLSMGFSSLKRAKEYAKEVQCMNNLRQIGIGYNNYMNDYKTDSPMPANGRFLDDMSIVFPYAPNIDIYYCPNTKNEKPKSIADLEIKLKESGNSITVNGTIKDYLATIYDQWVRQIYRGSQVNQGHGTSSYGINPNNPSGNFDLSGVEKGIVYENESGNHFRSMRNVIYVSDLHYIRYQNVSQASEDYIWFLTLNKNGRVNISEVVQNNDKKGKKK